MLHNRVYPTQLAQSTSKFYKYHRRRSQISIRSTRLNSTLIRVLTIHTAWLLKLILVTTSMRLGSILTQM